jgi:hypothetical protein
LGGGKTGRNPTDRGKLGVKHSVMVEAAGIPVALATDGAVPNTSISSSCKRRVSAMP